MREKKSEGPAPLPVFGQGHLSFWLQIPSQPLLTPELATGPRKLLKQPSGNPTFPLPHARNSGAPCAEQLQQKKKLSLMDEWWDRVDSTNTHTKQDAMFRHSQKPFSLRSATLHPVKPSTLKLQHPHPLR